MFIFKGPWLQAEFQFPWHAESQHQLSQPATIFPGDSQKVYTLSNTA